MCRTSVSLLLVFAMLAVETGCHRRHHEQEKIALKLPQGTPKRPHGSPALTVNPSAPQPFTLNDVATYFKTHNLPKNATDLTQFQVSSLVFLTSKEVTQRLGGEPTGLADIDKIGFVTLTGQFVFTGPSGSSGKFTRAYAAFDATTGNLLMIGTLSDQQEPRR